MDGSNSAVSEGVQRTAPATPGLLKRTSSADAKTFICAGFKYYALKNVSF